MVLEKNEAGKAEPLGLDHVIDEMMVAVAVAGRAATRAGAAEESEFHRSAPLSPALPRRSDRGNISAGVGPVEAAPGRSAALGNENGDRAGVLQLIAGVVHRHPAAVVWHRRGAQGDDIAIIARATEGS